MFLSIDLALVPLQVSHMLYLKDDMVTVSSGCANLTLQTLCLQSD